MCSSRNSYSRKVRCSALLSTGGFPFKLDAGKASGELSWRRTLGINRSMPSVPAMGPGAMHCLRFHSYRKLPARQRSAPGRRNDGTHVGSNASRTVFDGDDSDESVDSRLGRRNVGLDCTEVYAGPGQASIPERETLIRGTGNSLRGMPL